MDLNEYLDSLGLEAEDRTSLATILAKAGDKATAPMLMRADYTKKTQDLAKERDRLATEQATMSREYAKALKDLEDGRLSQATYEARLERIGKDYGLPEEEWKVGKTPVTAPVTTPPAFDPAFVTRLESAERNYAVAPEIAGALIDLQNEYIDTFGSLKGFSASALLKHARENKIPLRADPESGGPSAFDRLYKVNEKKHELLVKSITEKAKQDAEDAAQRRIDAALAGNATGDRNPNSWNTGSHLLSNSFKQGTAARVAENAKASGREVTPPSESRSAAQNELGGAGAAFARRYLERRAQGVAFGSEGKAA